PGNNSYGKGLITISDQEFELFRTFIYHNFGINLTEVKRALLVNRLQRILRKERFNSFDEYYQAIQKDKTGHGTSELIDAVSTNHTFFFREKVHFEYLMSTAFPKTVNRLLQKNDRDLRVWCAASSSGEEPYVLAMLIKEYLGQQYYQWSAGVLATDISNKALGVAVEGRYSSERLEQVPQKYKRNYFDKEGADEYRVKESLRKDVLFRRFNLMNETFPFKKPFHIIFCRNVMIYFDHETRDKLVKKMYAVTSPGGYLFIGNAETLDRSNCPYRYIAPSIYQRDE
ncbi:MAG: protein-glutamate O-methyltransferase CheR, partial [SAR324 cluster bacterium]|nr:protein-glutamate O-methyltransferase CheR [SAR324 cluster bacterium]